MSAVQREYSLTDKDFEGLRVLVREFTGINLTEAKRHLVYSRFSKRLRQLGLGTFEQYCELVRNGDGSEIQNFTNAITTNLTAFFREDHHFEVLGQQVIPELVKRPSSRIRVWSAGCSTGEEPYSIAITLLRHLPSTRKWDVKILATDLDTKVLETGSAGVYPDRRLEGMDEKTRRRWFRKGSSANSDLYRVIPELREMITFKQLNLMEAWPVRGPFDVIFCRNVVIYFDKPTQRILFDRYADLQQEGGALFVGHSETLANVTKRYTHVGRTVYRKVS